MARYHTEYIFLTHEYDVWESSKYVGRFRPEELRAPQHRKIAKVFAIYRLPGDKPLLHNGGKPR